MIKSWPINTSDSKDTSKTQTVVQILSSQSPEDGLSLSVMYD